MMATAEDLRRAVRDVVAIVTEHQGVEGYEDAPLAERLGRFGIPADALADVLTERWETYSQDYDPERPHLLFAQAAAEFLLIGVTLREATGG